MMMILLFIHSCKTNKTFKDQSSKSRSNIFKIKNIDSLIDNPIYFHKNGKPFKTKIYNNDGSIFILETEKNQRNESYQYIFYDNGNLESEGKKNGINKDGQWIYYYKNGLIKKKLYMKMVLLSIKFFDNFIENLSQIRTNYHMHTFNKK